MQLSERGSPTAFPRKMPWESHLAGVELPAGDAFASLPGRTKKRKFAPSHGMGSQEMASGPQQTLIHSANVGQLVQGDYRPGELTAHVCSLHTWSLLQKERTDM